MKYVLRYVTADGVDPGLLGELAPAHRAHWSSYLAERTLLAIGPMEHLADGALAVFTTRQAAESFAAGDPFVTGGAVSSWTVTGWREAVLGQTEP